MASGKFVSYIRVSTAKQGRSGLGLEAQRSSIMDYLNGGPWKLLDEFQEIESGKKDDRPELSKALRLCQLTGATLIIAKLDRLSRDIHFISSLTKAGIEFVACDMPQANKTTIHIFAVIAEQERDFIKERTKAALKAAKERGIKLGTDNLTQERRLMGTHRAAELRKEKALKFASEVYPIIEEFKGKGMSLRQIAAELNQRHILTARGLCGTWTASQVKVVSDRMGR